MTETMIRYTEEELETRPEDLTLAHLLSSEIACILAEEAGGRGNWEACRAWLEVADEQPFYRRIRDELDTTADGVGEREAGGYLAPLHRVPPREHFGQGPGLQSSQSEGLRSLDRKRGVGAERRADGGATEPLPDDATGMIAPDFRAPHLAAQTVGILVALGVASYALWAVFG